MDRQDESEFTMREDVLIFNEVLTQSGHNIKNYRKRHQALSKRSDRLMPASTECTQPAVNNFVSNIDSSSITHENHSNEKMKINLERLSMRRKSVTAGNPRNKQMSEVKTLVRTLHVGNNRQNLATSKPNNPARENKYKSIESQHNKGPMREKYIENWLNSLLLEACYEEKFDMTLQNPALKKFQLDRNSLLSKGIKVSHLTRLYKSLFVYSVGFNDLLNEICNGNMQLRKSIWKVYVILLEYCAQGSFEMMIAEIERDKTRKVEGLRQEIEKRQWVIENNEEINEDKNAKIYKEIKHLKEENENLCNEKEILMEEFKQAEQAFNQQVSLRLRFENRINQIHGVYTEIKVKHDRLITDFDRNEHELGQLRETKNELSKALILLKSENQKKTEDLLARQKELKYQRQLVSQLDIKKGSDSSELINISNRVKELSSIISEKDRQLEQKGKNYENLALLFQSEKNEHELKSQQFSASLEENSRLHQTVQEQMKELNALYIETRNFGVKTNEIKAESVIAGRKVEEMKNRVKELQDRAISEEAKMKKVMVDHEKEKKHREQLEKDLGGCYDQIKEMKQAKNSIEEALESNLKKIELVDEILDEKDKQIQQARQTIADLEQKNDENQSTIKTYESKISMMKEQLSSDNELNQRKMAALKEEKDKIISLYENFDSIKRQLELQLDKYKQLYEDTHVNLKNQLFQRKNLDVMYKQSLNVMEHENNHIKELNIQRSELNEEIFNLRRTIKNIQYLNHEKQKQFQKDKQFWQKEISNLSAFHQEKKFHIHPMLFEDAAANYFKASDLNCALQSKYNRDVTELQNRLHNTQAELEQLKVQSAKASKEDKRKYQQLLEKKNNEIAYEQERKVHLMQRIKDLEETAARVITKGNGLGSEEQQKYLARLKEKDTRISSLLTELEAAHDQNTKLRQTYALIVEEELPKKQVIIQELKVTLVEVKIKLDEEVQKTQIISKQLEEFISNENEANENRTSKDIQARNRRLTSGKTDKREGRSDKKYETISWKPRKDRSLEDHSEDKRNDFSRKYKGAYTYYHK